METYFRKFGEKCISKKKKPKKESITEGKISAKCFKKVCGKF